MTIDVKIKAQERYRRIANLFDDEESKNIFFNLAIYERNHQIILEDEIYQLSNKGTIIWEQQTYFESFITSYLEISSTVV